MYGFNLNNYLPGGQSPQWENGQEQNVNVPRGLPEEVMYAPTNMPPPSGPFGNIMGGIQDRLSGVQDRLGNLGPPDWQAFRDARQQWRQGGREGERPRMRDFMGPTGDWMPNLPPVDAGGGTQPPAPAPAPAVQGGPQWNMPQGNGWNVLPDGSRGWHPSMGAPNMPQHMGGVSPTQQFNPFSQFNRPQTGNYSNKGKGGLFG